MTLVGGEPTNCLEDIPPTSGARLAQRYSRLPSPLRTLLPPFAVEAVPASDKKVTVSTSWNLASCRARNGKAWHGINCGIPTSPGTPSTSRVEPVGLPDRIPRGPELLDRVQQWDLEVPWPGAPDQGGPGQHEFRPLSCALHS